MKDLVYLLLNIMFNLVVYHACVCRLHKVVINYLYRGFSLENIEESRWHKMSMVLLKIMRFFLIIISAATLYKLYLFFR